MKKCSYVAYGVAAAILLSAILFSSCKDSNGSNTSGVQASGNAGNTEGTGDNKLPIAYIDIDTILVNYGFAKDVNEKIAKKMEDIRLTVTQRTKKFENEVAEFQRKLNNNAFLSEERAQQESIRLQKQEQEIQELAQRLQNEWAMDQHQQNAQIADSILKVVNLINETSKYDAVFNKREFENIIVINPKYNITQDVLSLLNARYKPEAKK